MYDIFGGVLLVVTLNAIGERRFPLLDSSTTSIEVTSYTAIIMVNVITPGPVAAIFMTHSRVKQPVKKVFM